MDIRDVIVVLDFGRIELCFGAMHQGRIYIRAPYVLGSQPSVNRSCNPLAKRLPCMPRGRVITRVYFQFSPPLPSFSPRGPRLFSWFLVTKTFRSYDNEIGEEIFDYCRFLLSLSLLLLFPPFSKEKRFGKRSDPKARILMP